MIDAHVHIFPEVKGRIGTGPVTDLGHGRISMAGHEMLLFPCPEERTAHTVEMLMARLDEAGVEKAVLYQGPFYGECNATVAAALRAHPDRLRGLACLDPWEEGWEKKWDQILSANCFTGLKLEFSESTGYSGLHPGARLDERRLDPLWESLAKARMVLALDLGAVGSSSYQTDAVHRLAQNHPSLHIVIPHLGQPTRQVLDEETLRRQWMDQLRLGLLPHVFFDTSALPHKFLGEGDPFPGIRECLCIACDLISPGKLLWGTDIPGLLSAADYPRLVSLAHEHLDFLSETERAAVLRGNAARVYMERPGDGSGWVR